MPVTPAERPVGTRWTLIRPGKPPVACEIVERYDDIEKCMDDCCVRCDDGTLYAAFDFDLHAEGCSGSPRDMHAPWYPKVEWMDRKPPCACGAWPAGPEHKFKRLMRTKRALQTKAEIEHENLVVDLSGPIPIAVERKVS